MDGSVELKLLLKTTAVLGDFDNAALDMVVPYVNTVGFDADEYILPHVGTADLFYLVHKGDRYDRDGPASKPLGASQRVLSAVENSVT